VSLRLLSVSTLTILAVFSAWARGEEPAPAKVSKPGEYRGYSKPVYDGWALVSVYVPVRDGTKLAIDMFRPTRNGVMVDDRLPVVWMHSPYNRRPTGGKSEAEVYPGAPLELVKYGYVVAVADFRGLYASFGKNKLFNNGEYVGAAWTDAYDITEWLAGQPWSSGKIGMWGCSATGGSQLQAAAMRPPSLKAIFPLSPNFDAYDFANYGGAPSVSQAQPGSAAERDVLASPVDGPDGPRLLADAKAEHNDDVGNQRDLPFRDSVSPTLGADWWKRASPSTYVDALRKPGLGVYAAGNWDESNTKIAPALVYGNMPGGRAKLLFGPHGHCGWADTAAHENLSIQVEERRFFDYWLKGIDNGVMSGPAVTYYTYNAPAGDEWRRASAWPLPNERRVKYFLRGGAMAREPVLVPGQDQAAMAPEPALVPGRDQAAMGEPAKAVSTRLNQAAGGLLYETGPLSEAVEVTGYPVMNLWISADAADADVVTEISDVAPDGTTRSYQMVGRLRVSHRKLAQAPYRNFGLPYHSHLSTDAEPLPKGRATELKFAMTPMSYLFAKGHRMRLSVTFSNPAAQAGDHAQATVWSGPQTPSSIELPIIPGAKG
jgi:putative CocE/NonD family hydrolase